MVFPFILYLILSGEDRLFALFITISLLTDVADGYIARRFNLQTEIGAKLDSWADLGTYILAFTAIYVFKWDSMEEHTTILLVFAGVMALSYIAVFVKFGSLIGLHTYLFKIAGYLQGAFIIVLFVWGFIPWQYYISLGVGIVACIEEILIIMVLERPRSNVKGLYWMVKKESN
jgi:CDP-diacylglycerol--glycerol-3-phosphate 3-phosphatidyltransferase